MGHRFHGGFTAAEKTELGVPSRPVFAYKGSGGRRRHACGIAVSPASHRITMPR